MNPLVLQQTFLVLFVNYKPRTSHLLLAFKIRCERNISSQQDEQSTQGFRQGIVPRL